MRGTAEFYTPHTQTHRSLGLWVHEGDRAKTKRNGDDRSLWCGDIIYCPTLLVVLVFPHTNTIVASS